MDFRLNCNVCFECYDGERRRPRVLKCGHTLCTACTKRILKDSISKCPTCREPFQAGNLKDVAINYAIDGFLDTPVQEYLAGYLKPHPGFPRRISVDEASPCSSWGSSYTGCQDRQMSFSDMSSSPGSSFGSPGSHFTSGNQTEMPFGNGSPYFIPGYGYHVAVEDTTPSAPTLCESDVPDGDVIAEVQEPRQGKRKKSIAGKAARATLRAFLFLMD